jgi:hypothetical protein
MFSCGAYGEDGVFRFRDMAVSATFDAQRRLANRDLHSASFKLIERAVPANTTARSFRAQSFPRSEVLLQFGENLTRAQTGDEWKECVSLAECALVALQTTLPPRFKE